VDDVDTASPRITVGDGSYSNVVRTAQEYYNGDDAEAFYSTIWGGENIHIGLYEQESDCVVAASDRTVKRLGRQLEPLDSTHRVLDLGSGYGGTARFLARRFGCKVLGVNLSEVQNERARRLNAEQGLQSQVDIVDGNFESVDAPDESFEAVCSQDAMLHSGERSKVVAEAARVLKPGGVFAFCDIMQADTCPAGVLQPILDRIHLSSLGVPAAYREAARVSGLVEDRFDDLTPHMITHYARILHETDTREAELQRHVSKDYLQRMKEGLSHWVDGGRKGYLVWGIFTFRKSGVA
jgi:sarcosine/dimethylglycine N-methyltransferase